MKINIGFRLKKLMKPIIERNQTAIDPFLVQSIRTSIKICFDLKFESKPNSQSFFLISDIL